MPIRLSIPKLAASVVTPPPMHGRTNRTRGRAGSRSDFSRATTIWVAQRWADSGMPVTREGSPRLCLTRRTEPLAGTRICRGPVQIATEDIDRSSELKRGLSYVRKQSRLGLRKRRRPKLTGRALVWVQMRGAAGVQVLMMNFLIRVRVEERVLQTSPGLQTHAPHSNWSERYRDSLFQ